MIEKKSEIKNLIHNSLNYFFIGKKFWNFFCRFGSAGCKHKPLDPAPHLNSILFAPSKPIYHKK